MATNFEEQIEKVKDLLERYWKEGKMEEYEKLKKEKLLPLQTEYRKTYGKNYYSLNNEREGSKGSLQKEENKDKLSGSPAPILKWHGDKWNYAGSYDKDTHPNGKYFYQLPIPLMKYIWGNLNGKNGLKCRIMEILIGTREGFGISEKWICDTIGIDSTSKNAMASYRKARKELCELGWLEYNSNTHELFVCFDFLWEQVLLEEDN